MRGVPVGQDSHCESAIPGLNVDGGMAQYMLTNARAVVKLDAALQPGTSPPLADAGLTAYHCRPQGGAAAASGHSRGPIGAGGLGHIGIQSLTALTNAHITVVDRSEEALELARSLDAHETVLSTDDGRITK